jgi:hypothetical protein
VRQLVDANDTELLQEIGLSGDSERLDRFALLLAQDQCWFGYFDGVTTFAGLREKLQERIGHYRRYLNLNISAMPTEISQTKTVIGDPMLKAVQALKTAQVLSEDTKVFVRIDQYEQLTTLNVVGSNYGARCQQLIHKALAARDARVSYRIGTRRHGWPSPPTIYSTTDVLELKRDFDVIDMEEVFRRRENARTWVFPKFARDIFYRRLRASEMGRTKAIAELTMANALGQSLRPSERIARYVSTADGRRGIISKAVKTLPDGLAPEWEKYIVDLAETDLLQAWLTCAWVRQRVGKKNIDLGSPPAADGKPPWDSKPYWYKERVQHALMQIASANRQALVWSGEEDVLNLSGGQILAFLFLLQHIWDAWLRDKRTTQHSELSFPIEHDVQGQGVLEASIEWRSKQIEGPNARQRKTFIDALGEHFYVGLIDDKAMSYPGANGFSVSNIELDQHKSINDFLCESVSYGDLISADHTSKRKGERRTKYYLMPIISPYFRIPSVHTKEPEYVGIAQVQKWRSDPVRRVAPTPDAKQPSLWSEQEE